MTLKIDEILNKIVDKKSRLKGTFKSILSCDELEFIRNSYPLNSNINLSARSFVNGDYKRCVVCSQFIDDWVSKRTTCSINCKKKLRENNCIEKYGTTHESKSQFIKDKLKNTCIERYGVDNVFKIKEVQEKSKNTMIERYGVDNPSKSEIINKKRIKNNIEKYGTHTTLNVYEVQEKIKNTCIERYGVIKPLESKEIQNKIKNTCIERYGVDNVFKIKEVQEKSKNTMIERYGVDNPSKSEILNEKRIKNMFDTYKDIIFNNTGILITYEEFKELKLTSNINYIDKYSKDYIESMLEYIHNNKNIPLDILSKQFSKSNYIKKAKEMNYVIEKQSSSYEKIILSRLDEFNIKYEKNTRSIINPYELDIYIPEHKLAIEFNGNYWHSDEFVDKHYHQKKTKMCNDLGITLIHVYEYLFEHTSEIYKSIIKSKLQLNERVYARKCILKEVSKQEEKEFLNKYHLQGFVGSNKCYGLYLDNELLTLCSFGKSRFNKNYRYELLRNCTKAGITVVGGLSKIIKHYKKEIDYKDIICYSDASISYNKNSELTRPNYVWNKNKKIYKRYNTMKHKLINILEDKYNSSLSETENMKINGFNRIYDSGNYIEIL